ncbi:MAG: hypothetical protein SFU56_02500 [Capsulimonadales bacterium]|nr:hypothetical protein [Capsulimonadales bacterium]
MRMGPEMRAGRKASASGEASESAEERWWRTLWRDQPAFLLSLGYLALGLAGSYYYTQLFARFGINIFFYADVTDFLLVIFREPLVPGLTLAAGLALYLCYRIDGFLDTRFPAYRQASGFFQRWMENDPYFGKRGRSQRIWEGLTILIVILFVRFITPFCVTYTVNDIRNSNHRQVLVQVNGGSGKAGTGSFPERMRLVGTTGRFVFLFEPQGRQMHIIPTESVERLVVGAARDGGEGPSSGD